MKPLYFPVMLSYVFSRDEKNGSKTFWRRLCAMCLVTRSESHNSADMEIRSSTLLILVAIIACLFDEGIIEIYTDLSVFLFTNSSTCSGSCTL